jgi:Flp pilus assembly protein TadG
MNERRFQFARQALRCEQGNAAAEFAMVLPLLLILLFAFYEAGRLFWNYNVVASSARDAARFAARLPIVCPGSLAPSDETKVKQLARTGIPASGGTPLLPGWTSDSSVTVQVTCISNPSGNTYQGRYNGMAQIPTIKVTAAAPYSILFGTFFPSVNLTSVSTANAQVWTQ